MTPNITIDRAVSPREKRYYLVMFLVSIVVWLIALVSIVGALYVLCVALFIWFVNGLMIAHLKSEAVKVSDEQLAELNQSFKSTCQKLGCKKIPELFVMQSGGALNAFATKHSGRDFVVLYSDIIEAYGESSPEVLFIMGHEIGHIERNHIFKKLLTFPGSLIPLLGLAYHRACEATCDRYGLIASGDSEGAKRAIMILSGGKEAGKKMNSEQFASQHKQARGFFISWHELASGYPTLSQRVHNLAELSVGNEPTRYSRAFFGYIFAFLFSRSSIALVFVLYIGFIAVLGVKSVKTAAEKAAATPSDVSEGTNEDFSDEDSQADEEVESEEH